MKIGIILGSGLDNFADKISEPEILFEEKSGIHHKKVIRGQFNNREIFTFSGRTHIYESGSDKEIFKNIKLAHLHKIELIIITNAAGGLNPEFKIGDLMLITSVINLFGKYLKNGMSEINFNRYLLRKINSIAVENNLILKKGVYCASAGPNFETKSEIKFLKKIGADAVGMSTIPEMYLASSLGMKMLGLSCITNILSETSEKTVDHAEILEAGNSASQKLSGLISLIMENKI
ncbi:MAG: purine-nucleoside phosphorylase [Ignavibacteria bacterium]|nr:purine-nucleoside phosphorylase [Ignavibacteria bacterium]